MGYPAYPVYSESGNQWIGIMPSHWTLLRTDFTTASDKLQVGKEAMENSQVFHYSIPNVQKFGTAQVEEGNDIDSSKLRVIRKQILISKLNPRKATICIAEPHEDFLTVCSGEFVPIVPERNLCLRYCYYALLSDKVTKLLSSKVQSVTRSHQRVNPDDIRKLIWSWPPIVEQQKIADFLDWKTARIDSLIAKKKQLIEKLREKRMALITQAVTKGLDPDAPMRDSGIPWLGEVPEHWEVKRLKFILKSCKGAIKTGPFGSQLHSSEMIYNDVKVYNQKTVIKRDINGGDNYISKEKFKELKAFEIFKNDLLITTRGTIGRCMVVPNDAQQGILHPCLMRIQVDELLSFNRFVEILIQESDLVLKQLQLMSNATTIEVIYSDSLKEVLIPAPPEDEQRSIAKFLDTKINKVDGLILKNEQLIKKLTEYRTALITAATTGKIDVRNIRIPKTDKPETTENAS
ncbi:restriction endonuclease subunit S [Desulfonema ishimotonii]|uniref:Restriction endonuclease subunit S n=2 Tax=Desulfonema ishimotonii TaxID=45657 RepID=A0A401FUZ1_9BACT|nr:restriction endonuclease subunit S [Desulfonema ishimotonii]